MADHNLATQATLPELAERINTLARTTLDKAAEMGRLLAKAKAQVARLPWVEKNLDITPRTVQRFMRLADKYDRVSHLGGVREALDHLVEDRAGDDDDQGVRDDHDDGAPVDPIEQAAAIVEVHPDLARRALHLVSAAPDLADEVEAGNLTVDEALEVHEERTPQESPRSVEGVFIPAPPKPAKKNTATPKKVTSREDASRRRLDEVSGILHRARTKDRGLIADIGVRTVDVVFSRAAGATPAGRKRVLDRLAQMMTPKDFEYLSEKMTESAS